MRRVGSRNPSAAWLAILVLLASVSSAQLPPQSAKSGQIGEPVAAQDSLPQQAGQSGGTAASDQQEPGVKKQPGAGEVPTPRDSGYVFKTEVNEVVLHATVLDEHHRLVTNLGRDAFKIFDDGQPQRIHSFRRDDVPVALAIVIDNSGSMRDKRPAVNAAALNLVRASNPQDQVCVINFNNESYLDQDYTADIKLLSEALEHIESRGGTALYDALVATGDHLIKTAKLQKRVILVVTDGEDTASYKTLQQAVRAIAVDGGPVVYGIGILGHDHEKKAHRALRILAEQTGGVAFFPGSVSEVEAISQQIAHDIRNQYTIGYKPSGDTPLPSKAADAAAKSLGGYHKVVVKAEARGYKGLMVRTRSGYYLNDGQPSLGGQ